MKKVWIVLSALVLGIVGYVAFVFYQINQETALMDSLPTGELVSGVFAIQDDMVNMFLVEKEGKYIAFDAGGHAETIQKGLRKLQIDPLNVVAVFLTHTDYDHVAAAGLFKNAEVYVSKAEEQMIDGTTPRMLFFKNKLEVPYTTLADLQEVWANGTRVRGILTEGHTPGSMCYEVDGRLLFTGDLAGLKDGRLIV